MGRELNVLFIKKKRYRSLCIIPIFHERLVMEQTCLGKGHDHAVIIAGVNNLLIA
jgi:hypothetical protein